MEWIISTFASLALAAVTTFGWLDARKKAGIDLQIELNAPAGEKYTLRNHGNQKLYNMKLDAESLVGYRIDSPIFSFALVPKQPVTFEISPDRHSGLPDGVNILYKTRMTGRYKSVYVPLPRPKKIWDGASGEWIDNDTL